MGQISQYGDVIEPKLSDKLIGTSVGYSEDGELKDPTYNFTLQQLLTLFLPNIPCNTLQGVLDYGNTATQDIILFGTIDVTNLNVNDVANLRVSHFTEEAYFDGLLFDSLESSGTAGQVLSNTGSGVQWITPTIFTPTLQQVLEEGNTSDIDIILGADITANNINSKTISIEDDLYLGGKFFDSENSSGSNGQVLISLGNSVEWQEFPIYTALSPLFVNPATKTITIQQANSLQDGYLSRIDWINFDGKQNQIVVTTNGNSGPSTLIGNTLNIPIYASEGLMGLTVSSPLQITEGPTPNISIPKATALASGYLDFTDWNTFNDKQDFLDGSGIVVSTLGVISYITNNSSNWNTAYNNMIVSASVTGLSTKTLTLTQQDGGTITASWTDEDTGLTSVGISMPSAFSVANSPLTSNGTIAITGAGTSAQYIDGAGQLQIFPSITGFIPYIGATQNVDLGEYGIKAGYVGFDLTPTNIPTGIGTMYWDAFYRTVSLIDGDGDTTLQIGQEERVLVHNNTGATLTDGQVVYVTGSTGELPSVALASNGSEVTSSVTFGIVTEAIANGADGFITTSGIIHGLNTLAYTEGAAIWLGSTPGTFTQTKPIAPANSVLVGYIIKKSGGNGSIFVKIQNGYELEELHNVLINTPATGDVLTYIASSGLWENLTIADILGYTPANAARTLTINGTTYDLTANRTWNVGTVTSVSALTLGTSGTDLSSTVSNSTTTPVITLNVPTASSVNRGALSSADWTTFNNKQPAGNYITSLIGEATGTGPGATTVTLSNAAVIAKLLTGLNITGGSISSSDSILTAFGKIQNQINGLIGGSIYQGTWNANTNTPALASGVGTKGYYYIVSVAGSTNLDGITDWNIGDWAIYDGTAWQQVDNTDSVVSVNSQVGIVNLTTDNIPQGLSNLYFSNSLARAALSFTAGSGAYNNTTGVITIPTNNNQILNGSGYITLTSLNASSPLSYNNSTGVFSIQQATSSQNGYLSSTDWTTFNNKQSAITLTTTGTSGAATFIGNTLNIPNYAPDLSGYVPTSRTLTINGTAFDLSANRSWSVGTITSVGLTSATSGVTIGSSPITTSGNITLAIATASGSQNGLLSSTDWTTFNNKQNALTNPITGTGTTNYLSKFTSASTLGISLIYDDGTNVGIGTTSPLNAGSAAKWLTLNGNAGTYSGGHIYAIGGAAKMYHYVDNDGLFAHQAITGIGQKFLTDASERMRITSTGNVGIGTTAPSQKLQVGDGTGINSQYLRVFSAQADIYIGQSGGSILGQPANQSGLIASDNATWPLAIGTIGAVPLIFGTSNAERMRIASNGNVAIGDTTGSYKFYVNGGQYGTILKGGDLGTGSEVAKFIKADNSVAMLVRGDGNVGIGTSSPYQKLQVHDGKFQLSPSFNSDGGGTIYGYNDNSRGFTFEGGLKFQTFNYNGSYAMRDAMTINGSGNVGIGTTSPNFKLGIQASDPTFGILQAISNNNGGNATTGAKILYDASGIGDFWTGMPNGANAFGIGLYNGSTNPEYMRITSTGNVGIGTTAPSQKLTVEGFVQVQNSNSSIGQISKINLSTYNSNFGFRDTQLQSVLNNTTTGANDFYLKQFNHDTGGDDNIIRVNSGNNGYFSLYTINTERLRITSSGNVGIGTTSPTSKLQVVGNITINSGNALFLNNSGNTAAGSIISIGGGSIALRSYGQDMIRIIENETITLLTSDLERLRITSTGNVGIGTASPGTKLHVFSNESGNWTSTIQNGSSGGHTIYSGYNNGTLRYGIYIDGGGGNSSSYDLLIGSNKFLVRGDGNVGIGTASPSAKLEVVGAIKTSAPIAGVGTPGAFKIGQVSSGSPVLINKLEIEIDGTLYYIPLSSGLL